MALIKRDKEISSGSDGIALFPDVQTSLKAEKTLINAGYSVKFVAPPPKLRKGCDLAIEINMKDQADIERLFHEKEVHYTEIVPL